jgi:hypothetical protein
VWHQRERDKLAPCSLGLSATSQQYFSLRTNQSAATSHQPNEQAVERQLLAVQSLLVDADAKSETNTFELWKGRLQKSLASRDIC